MPHRLTLPALIALGLAASPAALAQEAIPVQVGGEPTLDACGGYGAVTGLDPQGDNFLSVRAGPGTRHARIDRLGPDRPLWLCDRKGNWIGVVYATEPDQDCRVSAPQATRAPYDGPCKSGWVYEKYVTQLAG